MAVDNTPISQPVGFSVIGIIWISIWGRPGVARHELRAPVACQFAVTCCIDEELLVCAPNLGNVRHVCRHLGDVNQLFVGLFYKPLPQLLNDRTLVPEGFAHRACPISLWILHCLRFIWIAAKLPIAMAAPPHEHNLLWVLIEPLE